MSSFYNIPNTEKAEIFRNAGEQKNMPAFAIEKDWWVVQSLAILFRMEIGEYMVFKGGTSLSKAWNLIERFSEDIDLAVDRRFYGFEGEVGKKQHTILRKKALVYITETLLPALIVGFKEKGLDVNIELEEIATSDQDPVSIFINYPNVLETPDYIQTKIKLEFGCRSLIEPFTVRPIRSFVHEIYPEAPFLEETVNVPTVDPERTLLEKIFLLHEEFQRPAGVIRVDRMSRHLYDIYKLISSPVGSNALRNKNLYTEIVRHRKLFTKLGGVNYTLHNPGTINPIPPEPLLDAWKKDYLSMQESMFGADSPNFEEILEHINTFKLTLNSLDWPIEE